MTGWARRSRPIERALGPTDGVCRSSRCPTLAAPAETGQRARVRARLPSHHDWAACTMARMLASGAVAGMAQPAFRRGQGFRRRGRRPRRGFEPKQSAIVPRYGPKNSELRTPATPPMYWRNGAAPSEANPPAPCRHHPPVRKASWHLLVSVTPPLRSRFSAVRFTIQQACDGDGKCVCQFHKRSDRGIAGAALQVSEVATLHRGALRKLLLRPAPRTSKGLDPFGEKPQDLSLGYGQPSFFRNQRSRIVRLELQLAP